MARRLLLLVASTTLTLGLSACGTPNGPADEPDPPSPGCSDEDGDGYGVGSECAGPDCDEWNPDVHECALDCDEVPEGTGCPCEEIPEPITCYEGPEGAQTHRPCRNGIRSCEDGAWTSCRGQVLPTEEICDDEDNDCDGETDEGVTSACGNCDPDCAEVELGDEDHPWNIEEEGSGGLATEGGALTLDRSLAYRHYVWIPNTGDATVSKVHARSYAEEGRYLIGPGAGGGWNTVGGISVNVEGNVALASTVGGARVTRVDGNDCPPGDTSRGGDDVLDWGDDACVVWSTELPMGGGMIGMIAWEVRDALDGLDRYLWVGDVQGQRVIEIDEDGELTDRDVSVSPVNPGALAMAPDGDLWAATQACALGDLTEIDTVHAEVIGRYGTPDDKARCMAIDPEGRVWVTGGDFGAYVYDADEETFTHLRGLRAAGVAIDEERYAWLGGYDGRAYRVDRDTMEWESFDVGFAAGWGQVHTAIDVDGMAWAVEMNVNEGHVFDQDDPGDFDAAIDTLSRPGACGDMTGTQLANVVEPSGVYRHVFEGCGERERTTWISLRYEAEAPAGSTIHFSVRTAEDFPTLSRAAFVPVGVAPADSSPLDIERTLGLAGIAQKALLEVQMTLVAGDAGGRPLLFEVGVRRSCFEDGPG